MEKPDGASLLVFVCILVIVVLSAVESGRIVGANYGFTVAWNQNGIGQPLYPTATNTTATNTTMTTVTVTRESKTNGTSPSPNSQSLFPPLVLPAWLVIPEWLLTALAVGSFIGACFLILRLRTNVRVINLEDTLKEMELQQKYLAETWSSRLRNAALLRYYLLMRRACAKVGLPEETSETPREYIGRVSTSLKVEAAEASRFANAVDRSRYGEELSQKDASEASRFMSAFTDVIRRKTDAF